jgi:hypothetical protein
MKRFKQVDLVLQATGILAGLVLGIRFIMSDFANILYGYFIVGAIQVLSLVIHYFLGYTSPLAGDRYRYSRWILIIFIAGAGSYLLAWAGVYPVVFVYLFLLLWFSPVLAGYYFYICWKEYHRMVKREFIHLK